MNKTEIDVQAADGHIIVATLYIPVHQTIKGHVHIFHGMAEHQNRYEHFAHYLVEEGYIVSTHDHRGHGKTATKNKAPFGYFSDSNGFEKVVDDAHAVITTIRDGQDWPQTIILGHSMGSFIARRYLQHYSNDVKKAIIMGTGGINTMQRIGLLLAKFLVKKKGGQTPATLMERLSFGSYNNKINDVKTPSDWLTTNEEEVQKYIADPWCGFVCTNQFYVDLLTGIKTVSKECEVAKVRKDLPILLISGKEDPVGEYGKGIWRVAKQYYHAKIPHIAVHLFEHQRHEILNETNNKVVYKTILKWLENKGHDRAKEV